MSASARIAGLKLGDGLASAILDDVGAEPGALALVEFALAELYERSGGERVTAEAYRALGRQDGANGNSGGIGGIVDRQAEQSVQDDQGRVDESTLAKIFPLLAGVDEKGGAVRKRAKLDDFVAPERALVDRLVNGRLLLTNREEGAAAWVEVAHGRIYLSLNAPDIPVTNKSVRELESAHKALQWVRNELASDTHWRRRHEERISHDSGAE